MTKSKKVSKKPKQIVVYADPAVDECIEHANDMFYFIKLIHDQPGITRFQLSRRCEITSDDEFRYTISILKHDGEIYEDAEGRFYARNTRADCDSNKVKIEDNERMENSRNAEIVKKVRNREMLKDLINNKIDWHPNSIDLSIKQLIYNNPGLSLFELSCACEIDDDFKFRKTVSLLKFRGEIFQDEGGFFYCRNPYSPFF